MNSVSLSTPHIQQMTVIPGGEKRAEKYSKKLAENFQNLFKNIYISKKSNKLIG